MEIRILSSPGRGSFDKIMDDFSKSASPVACLVGSGVLRPKETPSGALLPREDRTTGIQLVRIDFEGHRPAARCPMFWLKTHPAFMDSVSTTE
jgi:hypothetical protein